MQTLHLEIPTLYSNPLDFRTLATLCRQIMETTAAEIVVKFDQCTFFKANAVACISAALEYARHHGKAVIVDFSSVTEAIYRACSNYKFVHRFGGPFGSRSVDTIELRKFQLADKDLIV